MPMRTAAESREGLHLWRRAEPPDSDAVLVALAALLGDRGGAGKVTITARQSNVLAASFPSEILHCRLVDGRELQLFAKYGRTNDGAALMTYEGMVYRDVLRALGATVPHCYGTWVFGETIGLFVEYLHDGLRLNHTVLLPEERLSLAARWVGAFHTVAEAHLDRLATPALCRYDANFYRQWARRTVTFAAALGDPPSWLPAVANRYEQVIQQLTAVAPTIIHGDYYIDNLLVRDATVYPVDWALAAIGPAAIDLASLTDSWHREAVEAAEYEYERVRWPRGTPTGWHATLAAARLHIHLRLLGEAPDSPNPRKWSWRLAQMRSTAERLGLV